MFFSLFLFSKRIFAIFITKGEDSSIFKILNFNNLKNILNYICVIFNINAADNSRSFCIVLVNFAYRNWMWKIVCVTTEWGATWHTHKMCIIFIKNSLKLLNSINLSKDFVTTQRKSCDFFFFFFFFLFFFYQKTNHHEHCIFDDFMHICGSQWIMQNCDLKIIIEN